MPSHDSIEGSNASSSSLSYYIPGITAPARCLADDMDELRAMSMSSSSIMIATTTPISASRPTVSCCLSPESTKGSYRQQRNVVVVPRVVHFGDDLLSPCASSSSYERNTSNMVSPYLDDDEQDNVKMNTDSPSHQPQQQQHQQQEQQQPRQRQRRRRNEPTLTSFFRMEALRRSIEMEQQRVQQLQQEWDCYLGDDAPNTTSTNHHHNHIPMEIVVDENDNNENDDNYDDNDPLATPPPLPPLVFRLEEPNFY